MQPVTQPFFYHATQIKNKKTEKIKKVEKIKNKRCVFMNKNNINLLVYSLTPESGIKIPI
jgi:hypothetical protein